MKTNNTNEALRREIQALQRMVEDLSNQIRQLRIHNNEPLPREQNTEREAPTEKFSIGDKVIILSNGLIGKAGDTAIVTGVGKRVRIRVHGQYTNRMHKNLRHV